MAELNVGSAGGLEVAVDLSGCVTLRQRRVHGDDVELTVTDVERLRSLLASALRVRDTLDG